MKKNYLKEVLIKGEKAFGPFLKFIDLAVVEIMGFAGFNFVIIDQEHGPISVETTQNMIRAAESVNITPILDIPGQVENLLAGERMREKVFKCEQQGIAVSNFADDIQTLKNGSH